MDATNTKNLEKLMAKHAPPCVSLHALTHPAGGEGAVDRLEVSHLIDEAMDNSIPASEFAELVRSGKRVNLIDVRTPAEYRELHLTPARNVPLHELDPELLRQRYTNEPFYVVCQKGSRGRQACEQLVAAGLANVVNVEGGTEACVAAGFPVVRGRQTMSLERQVRIAAGSLNLLGVFLASLVHPMFIVLSAFVGAGLVFSGVTDTCGMGMLLARMPWNQIKDGTRCNTTVDGNVKATTP